MLAKCVHKNNCSNDERKCTHVRMTDWDGCVDGLYTLRQYFRLIYSEHTEIYRWLSPYR